MQLEISMIFIILKSVSTSHYKINICLHSILWQTSVRSQYEGHIISESLFWLAHLCKSVFCCTHRPYLIAGRRIYVCLSVNFNPASYLCHIHVKARDVIFGKNLRLTSRWLTQYVFKTHIVSFFFSVWINYWYCGTILSRIILKSKAWCAVLLANLMRQRTAARPWNLTWRMVFTCCWLSEKYFGTSQIAVIRFLWNSQRLAYLRLVWHTYG